MEDALTNDRVAEIFRREQSRLRSFVRKRVADEGDVEDILQDVFYELVDEAGGAGGRVAVSRGEEPDRRSFSQEAAGSVRGNRRLPDRRPAAVARGGAGRGVRAEPALGRTRA